MAPNRLRIVALSLIFLCGGCESPSPSSSSEATATAPAPADHTPYVSVRLDADLSTFSAAQKEMVPLLIEAAQTMDVIFWEQTYGNRDSLLQSLSDTTKRRYVVNNYGPWDRLRGNHAFVEGEAPRPPGANFYPTDVTPDSLFAAELPLDTLQAPHTMVRRLPDGTLTALPYHLFFAESMSAAAAYLTDAADLTENAALAQFLRQRAEALTTGQYGPSTRTWHALQAPLLDIAIGPMDTGEDRLLGTKAAAAALVLRHAPTRSQRFEDLSALQSRPSTRSLLRSLQLAPPDRPQSWNAYDALYVAGGVNTGPKPTVLPLSITKTDPSHSRPRRLLLSNVLNARTDSILAPTAEQVLLPASRSAVTIDALFDHTALQTWGRSLVDPTDDAASPVLTAALPIALSLALGPIPNENDLPAPDSTAHHTTALTDLVHTVRLDTTTTHGRAALMAFNYLREADAIRHQDGHLYTAAPDTVTTASAKLAHDLMDRRGGDAAVPFVERYNTVPPFLHSLFTQLDNADVPRALAFEQGRSVLQGLTPATATRSEHFSPR